MKNITVNVQLQFDQFDSSVDTKEFIQNTLEHINLELQRSGLECGPQILTSGFDESDIIHIEEDFKEGDVVEWDDPDYTSSGRYTVKKVISDEMLFIISEWGSEAEVPVHEVELIERPE